MVRRCAERIYALSKNDFNKFNTIISGETPDFIHAGMAELADVQDLGSCVERRAGSTPVTRTKPSIPVGTDCSARMLGFYFFGTASICLYLFRNNVIGFSSFLDTSIGSVATLS